jgi:hypothetical protein
VIAPKIARRRIPKMVEYIIRCVKDDASNLTFVRQMTSDDDASIEARIIMRLCDFQQAEIWRAGHMIKRIGRAAYEHHVSQT